MEAIPKDSNAFVHPGVVTAINGSSLTVSLEGNIHCDSCRAKGVCGLADAPDKTVEIMEAEGSYSLREPVTVVMRKELGGKAVFWAYLFPFLLMVGTLWSASLLLEEWVAGLLSLAVLIPYFAAIHWRKDYFKKTFRITLQRS